MSSEYTTLVQGLETYRLADLRPYHANPRRGDVAQIARSLSRTGQYRPIVVNAGTKTGRYRDVLAGNHTLAAALKLGWSHLAGSVVDVDDDTAARIVAADNRTAELGGYDDAQLLALLESVAAAEQGLEGTGYSDADLLALLERMAPDAEPEALTDPDEIPAEPAEPVTRPGDLWTLGDHRILCGDSTDPVVVAHLTGGRRAVLLHADPPYGMGKQADGVLGDNVYGAELVSSSPAGALVLEPFAGTGSTLIAAHDTGRVCYTAELSPAYVDTTVRRWQQHTGGTPQRNGVPHSLEP